MDIQKIKLIIWDLDETFWNGTISYENVSINSKHIDLINNLNDCGVINSICSKNEKDRVEEFLKQYNLWDSFVFKSINWSPKGERVKEIINEMNLRDVNVLFIDDNVLNLQEAKACCPNIQTQTPEIIPTLIEYFEKADKKDREHKRLEQYKILERKKQFKAGIGSNEEFLRQCDISVIIKNDCIEQVDRIVDLILRSNQLNFTKIRSTKEELIELFKDTTVNCGYVEVNDKFGDYGIVGFFAEKGNEILHFVFSCRTLNMGIEQYVYNYLNRPKITIVGEVSSSLDSGTPDWINKTKTNYTDSKKKICNAKTIIKGPCDMSAMFSFIKETKNIIKEFVYVNENGVSIEGVNHTTHIVQSVTLNEQTKERIGSSLPFGDKEMYRTAVFDEDVEAICLSLFTDPNLGLYKEKESGAIVAFGEWTNDLTDEALWNKFINKEVFVANCNFDEASLKHIKENFDFIGRISPQQTVDNLDFIYSHISDKTKLILNLGSEIPYKSNKNSAYEERHVYHKTMNELIKKWAEDKGNVYLIQMTEFIKSQDGYTNNINHFAKAIYFQLAQELIRILDDEKVKIRKNQFFVYLKKITHIPLILKRKWKLQ